MQILTLRTDNPEAEIGLFSDDDRIDYVKWQAHRELSVTILSQINSILDKNKLALKDLGGIIIYSGPGSFTGLRIGFSVANTLSYGLKIPIVSCGGKNWIQDGLSRLKTKDNDYVAIPEYGRAPNTTKPVK